MTNAAMLCALALLLSSCQDFTVPPGTTAPAVLVVTPNVAVLEFLGQTSPLHVRFADQQGRDVAGRPVTWSSSHPHIVSVDSTGRVTALAPGDAEIFARADALTGKAQIAVRQRIGRVQISGGTDTLDAIGKQMQLIANATDIGQRGVAAPNVVWSSNDPGVASVDQRGVVTAVRAGAATITAVADTVSARVTVVVHVFSVTRVAVDLVGNARDPDGFMINTSGQVLRVDGDTTVLFTRVHAGAADTRVESVASHCTSTQDRTSYWAIAGDTNRIAVTIRCFGDIAYEQKVGNAADLKYIDDMGNVRVLALNVDALSAVWSPDGSRIAYARTAGGSTNIYVQDLQSGMETRLTRAAQIEGSPSWSPDGRFIAYRGADETNARVYTIPADGSGDPRLLLEVRNFAFGGPIWSPRNDAILIRGIVTPTWDLWELSPTGGMKALTSTMGFENHPVFSNDGQWIAMGVHDDVSERLAIIPSGRGEPRFLASDHAGLNRPAWSPDDAMILFMKGWKIYGINPDGTDEKVMTQASLTAHDPAWIDNDFFVFVCGAAVSICVSDRAGTGGRPFLFSGSAPLQNPVPRRRR